MRVFTALEPVYEAEGASEPERDWRLGDVGGLDLRALAERYSDTRDELAYRKLRGEALSLRDRLLLRVLNEITRMVMPRRDPIPDDVLDAVAEARRIRARRGG